MYDIGQITQATSVQHALQLLQADPEALVICGGSDVLIKIREGKLAGCRLVSIHGLPELSGVHIEADGSIVIGPATTFSQLTNHPLIQKHLPTLGYAVDQAGGPQLRNIGTIGGNVCNGMTSADSASTLLTLNATLELTGPGGGRRMAQEAFYAGPGRVHLAPGELLTAIRIAKADYEGYGGHYIKYAMRNAMDIATLGCAVHAKQQGGLLADVRLAFGVAAPVPIRCRSAEAAVRGKPANESTFALFGQAALADINPRTSWRASKEFRTQLARELSARALREACKRAAEGGKA